MGQRVDLVSVFYHPKTGRRISQARAKLYNKRAKKPIKPESWLVVRATAGDPRFMTPEQYRTSKRHAGRILYSARLPTVEKILTVSSFHDRHIRRTLGAHRVYKKLWDDFRTPGDIQRRGGIRISVSGDVEGRRMKEIIHLPFMRSVWQQGFSSEAKAEEGFKEWLVGSVLSNLRRRGVRLSNPVESAARIGELTKNRQGMLNMLEMEDKPEKRGGWIERVKWATDAIRQQKKLKQLKKATIRIEKLV